MNDEMDMDAFKIPAGKASMLMLASIAGLIITCISFEYIRRNMGPLIFHPAIIILCISITAMLILTLIDGIAIMVKCMKSTMRRESKTG